MKICVYSEKGGAGKTPIATNLMLELDMAVATNQHNTGFRFYDCLTDGESLFTVSLEAPFPNWPSDVDVVFDLAGAISRLAKSVSSALLQSDVVLIPVFNDLEALPRSVQTLKEVQSLKGFKGRIAFVATRLKKRTGDSGNDARMWRDFQSIAVHLHEAGVHEEIPIFPLRETEAFHSVVENELSINQLRERSPLARWTYRSIAPEFDAIISFIKE